MKPEEMAELGELKKLRSEGSLDATQLARLADLLVIENAEKTAANEKINKDFASVSAQKDHFRTKAEKEEAERKALEEKLNSGAGGDKTNKGLDVSDFIDISASLEGLDMKEKEKLTREHKLTGKPLSDIRKDEDFILWQEAYRSKLEKEKALRPSSTQADGDKPKGFMDKLRGASIEEKEKMLVEAGLYKTPRPRSDRRHIGAER